VRLRDALTSLLLCTTTVAAMAYEPDRSVLPITPPPFGGVMEPTVERSRADFPPPLRAPDGAPNVLLIMTDDVGFGAVSTFGGAIPTPNLDRLAGRGLRYNRFHTTAMCSPTRAALLTGRNHHAVGTATVVDTVSGYPGYSTLIPRTAATIAEVLRLNGWNTAFYGKHHNVPSWQTSAAGPFDYWPTGIGFEHFLGFLGGDTDQWSPKLYNGTQPVDNPDDRADELLDRRLADDALRWLGNQQAADPEKPFFLYFAPGTAHSPHQAPAEWIARFRGEFDAGWDVLREETYRRQLESGVIPRGTRLSPRPAEIPAWNTLSAEQQRFYARMMEVFAATVAYQDAQIGRLLDEIERMGITDNTLVMFIEGDNGSSAEGGPRGSTNEIGGMLNQMDDSDDWRGSIEGELGGRRVYQLLPVGWSWAMNAPFQWTKQVASHLGGTRNGLVVAWPNGIRARGETRSHFTHVTDIVPTILEAAGLPAPRRVDGVDQQPIDGVSLAYSFDDANAPERHRTQYFEMWGNRAIYHEGWIANTSPGRMPWDFGAGNIAVDQYRWELYDLSSDYSQSQDIARRRPGKLAELQALFDREARRNNVYPLDDRMGFERAMPAIRAYQRPRDRYVYWSGGISVPPFAAPMLAGKAFRIVAELELPDNSDGVVIANGSHFGGWSLYLDGGRPVFHYAASQRPADQFVIAAQQPVPAGRVIVTVTFDPSEPGPGKAGKARILVGEREVAAGAIGKTIFVAAGIGETLDTGRDTGVPVTEYPRGHELRGRIERIEVIPQPLSKEATS
jgi:arylsulfatase A-like enzyme